jgi:dTDP-4-dehydrorhamnose 3,5-epimerase-like enzyme
VPQLIDIHTHVDARGKLSVIDHDAPFDPRRIYWIYGVDDPSTVRGGHRHRINQQLLVCVSGSCRISGQTPETDFDYLLDSPARGLLLEPEDWHIMHDFSPDAVLLVLASEQYDREDYLDEPYRPKDVRT